jgi:hypothetical protein
MVEFYVEADWPHGPKKNNALLADKQTKCLLTVKATASLMNVNL